MERTKKDDDAYGILQQVVFGFWRIWKCRNEVVFKGIRILPHVAIELWKKQVEEFREAVVDTVVEGGGPQNCRGYRWGGEDCRWKKPTFGELKLNYDAAWPKDTKLGGVGWVLQDFTGIPKLVGGVRGKRYVAAVNAEAEEIRQGM